MLTKRDMLISLGPGEWEGGERGGRLGGALYSPDAQHVCQGRPHQRTCSLSWPCTCAQTPVGGFDSGKDVPNRSRPSRQSSFAVVIIFAFVLNRPDFYYCVSRHLQLQRPVPVGRVVLAHSFPGQLESRVTYLSTVRVDSNFPISSSRCLR